MLLQSDFVEEMLFCQSSPIQTTAEDVLNSVGNFITENKVNRSKFVRSTTGGPRAMSRIHTGLIAWFN